MLHVLYALVNKELKFKHSSIFEIEGNSSWFCISVFKLIVYFKSTLHFGFQLVSDIQYNVILLKYIMEQLKSRK